MTLLAFGTFKYVILKERHFRIVPQFARLFRARQLRKEVKGTLTNWKINLIVLWFDSFGQLRMTMITPFLTLYLAQDLNVGEIGK